MNILAFGEVLFDVFNGNEKIGGAPLNVAAHMSRLGANAWVYSAVGSDGRAFAVRSCFHKYGVADDLLLTVDKPTGICMVTLDEQAMPTYDLVKPVAWDAIPWTDETAAFASKMEWDLVCFGSLSRRSEISSATFDRLIESAHTKCRLFDCNIRPPYYTREVIERSLLVCTHLKISREDALAIEALGLNPAYANENRQGWCEAIADQYGLRQIILTLDKEGAAVWDRPNRCYYEKPAENVKVVSTVGAGDSFVAAYMYSQLSDDSIPVSLEKAIHLCSQIIQIPGALPE